MIYVLMLFSFYAVVAYFYFVFNKFVLLLCICPIL